MGAPDNTNQLHRATDLTAAANQPGGDTPLDRFRAELADYFQKMAKEKQARDAVGQPLERASWQSPKDPALGDKDPFEHANKAIVAALELKQLFGMNQPDTAMVNDGSGDKTVAQLRTDLQTTVRNEMKSAIDRADALKQSGSDDSVESLLTKFRQDPNKDALRQQLAQQFGVSADSVTPEQLQALVKNAPADQQQKAQQFFELEKEFQDLNQLRMASSVVRMQYSDILASGVLNPDGAGAAGGRVPIADATQAFSLVHGAGNMDKTGEVRNSADFSNLVNVTTNEFSQGQTQLVTGMLQNLQNALNAEKQGNSKDAEAQYKQAVDQAGSVDLSFLIQNINNQKDPEIQKKMVASITAVETTREDYARFLIQQGRSAEALPYLTKIQGEVPQLVASDATFNQLMSQAINAGKNISDDPTTHLTEMQSALDKKDYAAAFDDVQKAKTALAGMPMDQYAKDKEALVQQQQDLAKQKQDLDKDNSLSAQDKQTKQALLQQQIQVNAAYLSDITGKLNMKDHLTYMEGYVDFLRKDNDAAHAKFEEFKKDNPQLAGQKDYNLDALLDATKHKSFWDKYGHYITIGGAVLAGLGAAAATFYLGPGAVAAGAAAFGATMTLTGGALTAATLGTAAIAGTGVYVAGSALHGEKITGKTVLEGAGYGLLGGTLFLTAPAVAAESGGLSLGSAPDALLSRIGSVPYVGRIAAPVLSSTIRTGLFVSVPQAAIHATENLAYNHASVGGAAVGFLKDSTLGAIGGRYFATAVPIVKTAVIPAGYQGYQDARDAIHGPLNPTSDQVEISQRQYAVPGATIPPDAQNNPTAASTDQTPQPAPPRQQQNPKSRIVTPFKTD